MATTRKTPWLLITLLVLSAAGVSAGGMYFFMSKNKAHVDEPATVQRAEEPVHAPMLVTIAPVTVNIQNERNEQNMLYVGFALEVGNDTTQKFLLQYMPQLRSRLLTLLGGQDTAQLVSAKGKEALAANILATFKQPLAPKQPELSVLNVLYTDFIVQ
ncbi:flagellar basal body-associated protein FliL [Pseudomonas cichorii]|nr:flagellar basal body-associated protein FliL [Pseudomonas cichorii]MBX8534206.1 flagellar basal body-associated protein FliL [Pseudomonas cichorii]MBX8570463.1 flagellar basal body-associated protein FliL [Pseudomonas cichorii]